MKSEDKRVVNNKKGSNTFDLLWNLFGKSLNIDATDLVEDSLKATDSVKVKKQKLKTGRDSV